MKRSAIGIYGICPIHVLQDKGITKREISVYIAISSFQGMSVNCWPSLDEIGKRAGIRGIHKISVTIKSLEERGWVTKTRRGLQKTNVYSCLYPEQESLDLPNSGKSDLPELGNTDLPKTGKSYIEKNNRKEQLKEQPSASFSSFWQLYDKKVSQKKCFEKWNKIDPALHQQIFTHVKSYVKSTPDKKYRKNPLTYLNGENWTDEIVAIDGETEITESFAERKQRMKEKGFI